MKFQVGDDVYPWEGRLTVQEAMFIYDKSKIGIAGMTRALAEGNPFLFAAMLYLAKTRAGEALRYEDLLELDMATVRLVPDDDEAKPDSEKEGSAPDPTPLRSGKSRKRDTQNT